MKTQLTTTEHQRDVAGLQYVYPVVSRRAGGVSIGINFNTNNACNWRCIYCQVPNLTRGAAPELNFVALEQELTDFLADIRRGDFFERFDVPPEQRIIKDIAISGNGEPTSLNRFAEALDLIGRVAVASGLLSSLRMVLISNGSLLHRPQTQDGLRCWQRLGGEVWFKLDCAEEKARRLLNGCRQSNRQLLHSLRLCASLCTTRLQTCMVGYRGLTWTERHKQAYLQLLRNLQDDHVPLAGVMLYTVARTSCQPEAADLRVITANEMHDFAARIIELGYDASVSV